MEARRVTRAAPVLVALFVHERNAHVFEGRRTTIVVDLRGPRPPRRIFRTRPAGSTP